MADDKFFLLQRTLIMQNGSAASHLVMTLKDEKMAVDCVKEIEGAYKGLLEGQIVVVGPKGAKPLGLTVGGFLMELGVANLRHEVAAVEPKGVILHAPRAGLIVPS